MSKKEMQIGEISKPRFEFRTFGQNFEEAAKRMARFSVPIPEMSGNGILTRFTSCQEQMI